MTSPDREGRVAADSFDMVGHSGFLPSGEVEYNHESTLLRKS